MPIPTGTVSTGDLRQELEVQVGILDAMFDDPGLRVLRGRYPDHPAVLRRAAIGEFLRVESRPYPDLIANMVEVSIMNFDRQFWMPDPQTEDFWSFLPDRDGARRVRRNLEDPRKFEETLSEVRIWAQLGANGCRAVLLEEDSRPDIRVGDAPAWVEVKYVHAETPDQGLLGSLQTANRQIRETTDGGAGVVYLWLGRPTYPREIFTDGDGDRLSTPPADVLPRLRAIEHVLSGQHYRSVAKVVCVWYDVAFIMRPDGQSLTLFVGQKFDVREHANPRDGVVLGDDEVKVGGWTAARIGPFLRADPT